jgi:Fur family transcriptional regulator, ferric uptake regulator
MPHSHHHELPDTDCLHCQALDRAKEAGLRRTKALEEVLRLLIVAPQPLTLADIAGSQQLADKADRATIYRLLMKLQQRGIIRRLGLHDRAAYFTMLFPGKHSDYLICTECGSIQHLSIACPVEAIEADIAEQSGFTGLYHELEFFGLCPQCRA